MSINNIEASLERAERRFGTDRARMRAPRSDRGRFRLSPAIEKRLAALVNGDEQPAMHEVRRTLQRACRGQGVRCPSRAMIYNFMARAPVRSYRAGQLPAHVRDTLFNLTPDIEVPGDQVVFHCLNYGGTDAISFAAGLPWRHLHRAARKRGWRAKSRGLLDAIIRARRA